jgi:hypothetical protein
MNWSSAGSAAQELFAVAPVSPVPLTVCGHGACSAGAAWTLMTGGGGTGSPFLTA